MANTEEIKSAQEIINEFFTNLSTLDGIDDKTAAAIQKLWNEDNLHRDELLSKLKTLRDMEAQGGEEEA